MLRGRNSLYNYAALPTQNKAPNIVMLGERNSLHNYFRGNEWPSPRGWARLIKEGAGVHGSFCRPAAVSRYPGAVVPGSARTGPPGRTRPSRGQRFPHLLQVCLLGLAAAGSVRPNPPPAHVSEWSHPGHHRRDGNVQPGAARLILGVFPSGTTFFRGRPLPLNKREHGLASDLLR